MLLRDIWKLTWALHKIRSEGKKENAMLRGAVPSEKTLKISQKSFSN